jgi:hypothetical protein
VQRLDRRASVLGAALCELSALLVSVDVAAEPLPVAQAAVAAVPALRW